jgi:hypothetical protein
VSGIHFKGNVTELPPACSGPRVQADFECMN